MALLFSKKFFTIINHYQKSDKAPFVVYPDLQCIIEKIDGCKNNPKSIK